MRKNSAARKVLTINFGSTTSEWFMVSA